MISTWATGAPSAGENAGSHRNSDPRGRPRPPSSLVERPTDRSSSICSPLTTRKIRPKHACKLMTGALHQNRATFRVTGQPEKMSSSTSSGLFISLPVTPGGARTVTGKTASGCRLPDFSGPATDCFCGRGGSASEAGIPHGLLPGSSVDAGGGDGEQWTPLQGLFRPTAGTSREIGRAQFHDLPRVGGSTSEKWTYVNLPAHEASPSSAPRTAYTLAGIPASHPFSAPAEQAVVFLSSFSRAAGPESEPSPRTTAEWRLRFRPAEAVPSRSRQSLD